MISVASILGCVHSDTVCILLQVEGKFNKNVQKVLILKEISNLGAVLRIFRSLCLLDSDKEMQEICRVSRNAEDDFSAGKWLTSTLL